MYHAGVMEGRRRGAGGRRGGGRGREVGGEMGGGERGEGYSHESWRIRMNLGGFA